VDFRRRRNRLQRYDYASKGLYFVTICAQGYRCIFGNVVVGDMYEGTSVRLTETGALVSGTVEGIALVFSGVNIHKYVVMPNHIHILLELEGESKPLSVIINYIKGYVTRRAKGPVWQKSFHDHIVRNEQDYRMIWAYIDNNPAKWAEDHYYIP